MIDVSREELLTLREAARLFQSGRNPGRTVSINTVYRWSLKGVRGVRLGTIVVGGIRRTSRGAISQFLQELNDGAAYYSAPEGRDSVRAERTRSILSGRSTPKT